MNIEKICLVCGVAFCVPSWRENKAKTCSQKCRGVLIAKSYQEQRVALNCKTCGEKFYAPPSHATRRVYCSRECAKPSRNAAETHPRNSKHYLWNGGRSKRSDGYMYLAVQNHPYSSKGTYVLEHRVVMETWMREVAPDHRFLISINGEKFLSQDIEVHHINEFKSDNKRLNLLACTPAAHHDIHNGKPPMQGEVWPEIDGLLPFTPRRILRICETCNAEFIANLSATKNGGAKFCTRECYRNRKSKPFEIKFRSE